MRGVRSLGALGVTFVAVLLFAAPASAENFIIQGGPGWPNNGLIIAASGTPDCAVSPYCAADDPRLGLQGSVVGGGPYEDCFFTYHYHGRLYGVPDPAPNGCGWGPLVVHGEVAPNAQRTAEAITFEILALIANDIGDAKRYIGLALSSLKGVSASLTEKAAKLDRQAKEAIKDDKLKKAGKKLDKALRLKQEYFDSLFLIAR